MRDWTDTDIAAYRQLKKQVAAWIVDNDLPPDMACSLITEIIASLMAEVMGRKRSECYAAISLATAAGAEECRSKGD